MTSLLLTAKNKLGGLPYALGWSMAQIPFSVRPGVAAIYNLRRREMVDVESMSQEQLRKFVLSRMQSVAEWAYHKVPFYADLYKAAGVDPTRFRHFEELMHLPIVTKRELQAVPLAYRTGPVRSRAQVNTGGSSGQPLEFYVEPDSIPHEWAHMHLVWGKVGYRSKDLKLAFAGRSDIRDVLQYDALRHHYAVNIYAGWDEVADRVESLPFYKRPAFLHGYPSALFDFIRSLDVSGHPALRSLKRHVHGLLLGSEYPAPAPREEVERLLGCSSVSWYGHTERAILAYEHIEKGRYHPFLSYGFVEAIDGAGGQRLIGTSYYNRATPFIRYDTGDLVDGNVEGGIVESFRIKQGRSGEYVLDKRGQKVFLTGLIFGRHHNIFDHCTHIQVSQESAGKVIIYLVPKTSSINRWESLFNSENVLLDFTFRTIDKPFRTESGKVPLLVR